MTSFRLYVPPHAAVICAQILTAERFAYSRSVTLAPPSLPAFPRGIFDLPTKRECEADGAQHFSRAA